MTDWKDLLDKLFTALHKQKFEEANQLRCGVCKSTLEDILKIGRLGCPQCYDIFGSTLRRLVEQMNTRHVGKRPKSGAIKTLEKQMVTAALEGHYKEADRLRDEIKRLK